MANAQLGEIILRASVLTLLADEVGHDEELEAVAACYRAIVGQELGYDRIRVEIDGAQRDTEGAWGWLASQQLSEAERDAVLKAVIVVCIADAELQEEELGVLNRMASTFGVSGKRVRTLMSEVWRESRR